MEGMGLIMFDMNFYKDKKVFVTGHTGFKGSWLCKMLINAGAKVTGYSLEPNCSPSLFELSGIKKSMTSVIGDIRNMDTLKNAFEDAEPEIVFHLAAQPIVRESYADPKYTYETNVMGTVNILECVRNTDTVKSIVNVTTDKVYRNNESSRGFTEEDFLDGYDPYSNSKSCSELVTHSYSRCFFKERKVAVSTARAGNVIGGGDFAKDRIIPDCVRSALNGEEIIIRNPFSVRPFQHVLEPLTAYLMIAKAQYQNIKYSDSYNIGPDKADCVTVGTLADMFCLHWGDKVKWKNVSEANAPHEAGLLILDCNKLKSVFNWKPVWNIEKSIEMICKFNKTDINNIPEEMDSEINEYLESFINLNGK